MANLKQIKRYLVSKKLPHKVFDLEACVYTVKGVVETGVEADEIVKTLIIKTNEHFAALAIRGKDRLDFKKVRRLFGSKSELAKPNEVLKVCEVGVGAVCPILLGIPVYFDKRVMNLKNVNLGSGDLTCGLEMDLADLLKAVGKYQVEDLIKIAVQIKL